MRTLLVFGVVFLKCILALDDGESCDTPLGDPGVCINIKNCDGLMLLLRTQSNNPEIRNFLFRAICGYEGTMPRVCCPRIGSQFTTTTTSAPVTRPVTRVPTGGGIVDNNNGGGTILTPAPTTGVGIGKPRTNDPFNDCGVANSSNTRVVGGVPALLGEFPWVVALGYTNPNNPSQYKWLCGGSLVSRRHILTAAHCAFNRPDLAVARVGDLDLYDDADGAHPETIRLVNAKIHENYKPNLFVNDIAILTLEHQPTTRTVWPICLPSQEPLRSNKFEKYNAFIAGWGATSYRGLSSSTLQKAFLPIVDTNKCRDAYTAIGQKTVIDDRVICAGTATGAQDSCQGDSGGPLMLGRTERSVNRFYQIGLVSYGYKCAEPGFPGVYTRITMFVDWIQANTV